MAYASWSVVFGEQPSAAKWNILGTNDASFNDGTGIAGLYKNLLTVDSNPYKFFVYRNSAQTLGASGVTKIQFDTELYDTNNNFDSSTNYRYTAPVSGFYQLSANFVCNNATAANVDIGIGIYKNGSRFIHGNNLLGVAFPGVHISSIVQLAANDYVEVYGENGNGNTSALFVGNSPIYTHFSGFLVSRT